ncbi:hypothetical protein BMS3Abin15_00028 [bacterium BMS3Abin15]|nr:hypothetical protein BMS3Abin15_00028 [bacterium BMS3Abin15]HDH07459.1 hypothetical protein [Candidatus Moranbacteria bacterium]HDZ85626.1 hypothetical protein [Candidatus Moranbacteria bacterium]
MENNKNYIHDFENLPKYLASKCPKCETPFNNAEDTVCSSCGISFYKNNTKPKGMTQKEIDETIKNQKIEPINDEQSTSSNEELRYVNPENEPIKEKKITKAR